MLVYVKIQCNCQILSWDCLQVSIVLWRRIFETQVFIQVFKSLFGQGEHTMLPSYLRSQLDHDGHVHIFPYECAIDTLTLEEEDTDLVGLAFIYQIMMSMGRLPQQFKRVDTATFLSCELPCPEGIRFRCQNKFSLFLRVKSTPWSNIYPQSLGEEVLIELVI